MEQVSRSQVVKRFFRNPRGNLFLNAVVSTAVFSSSLFLQSRELFFLGILLSLVLFGVSDFLGLFLVLNGVLQFQGEKLVTEPYIEAGEALIALGLVALLPGAYRQLRRSRINGRLVTTFAAPWIVLALSLPGWGGNSWYLSLTISMDPLAHIILVGLLFANEHSEKLKVVALGVLSVALSTAWVSLLIGIGPNIYQDSLDLRAGGTIGHPNLTAAIASLVLISLFRRAPSSGAEKGFCYGLSIVVAQLAAVSAILASGTRSVGFTLIFILASHLLWEIMRSRRIDLGNSSISSFGILLIGSLALSPMTSLFPRLINTVVDWLYLGQVPSSLDWRISTWERIQQEGRPGLLGPATDGFDVQPHSLYLELLYQAGAIATITFVLLCSAIVVMSAVRGRTRVGLYWLFGLVVGFTDPIYLWSGFGFSLITFSIVDWQAKRSNLS